MTGRTHSKQPRASRNRLTHPATQGMLIHQKNSKQDAERSSNPRHGGIQALEPPANGEGDAHEERDHAHGQDRPYSEEGDVQQTLPEAGDLIASQDQQHDSGAPRQAMDDTDDVRLQAEEGFTEVKEAVGLFLLVLPGRAVGMDVDMRLLLFQMLVGVERPPLQLPENLHPQKDEHDAYAKLEHRSNRLVEGKDGLPEQQDSRAQYQQWGGMPQTP